MFSISTFRDDLVTKTAIGVLGDLADTLGNNAGSLIQQSVSSKDFLNECLASDDPSIKESADWAKLAISRAISFWNCGGLGMLSFLLFMHWVSSDRVGDWIPRVRSSHFWLGTDVLVGGQFLIISNFFLLSFTFCILFLALPWRRLVVTRDSCVCHLGSREMKLWKNLKEKNRKEKS